jgi:hypothetical protein
MLFDVVLELLNHLSADLVGRFTGDGPSFGPLSSLLEVRVHLVWSCSVHLLGHPHTVVLGAGRTSHGSNLA